MTARASVLLPAARSRGATAQERLLFGLRQSVYSFPTDELCDFLRSRIEGRVAIEIGARHGLLAEALSIPATDNHQHEDPELRACYAQIGQPTAPYGKNVEKLDAVAAIEKYRPNFVIACWITHRLDPDRLFAGGSVTGVEEASFIEPSEEVCHAT